MKNLCSDWGSGGGHMDITLNINKLCPICPLRVQFGTYDMSTSWTYKGLSLCAGGEISWLSKKVFYK